MMRPSPSRLMVALLLAAVAVMLQAPDAFAIADDISTSGFSCSGGTASGNLFVSGDGCPTSLTMDNVFSFLVCNFQQLSSNIMGKMYCGMILQLAPSVMAAVTLTTAIYGVMFTFGMIPATGKEALKFLLKCAFVVAFTTNADYLIGIAYRGALGAISGGASIAIGLMSAGDIHNGTGVYSQLDGFLSNFFHAATDMMGGKTPQDMCKNAIFAVLATMFVVFPFLGYMGLLLLTRIILTFFRAVFAYIYAVVAITFVLLLAPFFIVFSLFKLTSNLFERWLGYLVSFALQVVLLFSFLAFIFSMHLEKNQVVTNLTSVIMYNAEHAEGTSFSVPIRHCTLCDFKVVNSKTDKDMKDTDPDYIKNGKMICVDHSSDSPAKPGTVSMTDPATGKTIKAIPIRPTLATSPDSKGQLGSLLSFTGNGILSLIILALIIEHLLKLVPSLAQKLASNMSANYATQLGGGFPSGRIPTADLPGSSIINNYGQGFERGFGSVSGKYGLERDGLSATLEGIKQGTTTARGGLGDSLRQWLTDPTKFGQ